MTSAAAANQGRLRSAVGSIARAVLGGTGRVLHESHLMSHCRLGRFWAGKRADLDSRLTVDSYAFCSSDVGKRGARARHALRK